MILIFKKWFDRFNDFLDRYVLPWPVRFLTFRLVILITIGLLIPLIVFANNTVLVLSLNSYLNTMSVAVSSIVLLYATINEVRQKQIAEMQEKRAQEDHQHVTDIHILILQTLQNQQEEIMELKQLLATMTGKELTPVEPLEVPDLQAMHPRGAERYTGEHLQQQWDTVHKNSLVSTIHEGIIEDLRD